MSAPHLTAFEALGPPGGDFEVFRAELHTANGSHPVVVKVAARGTDAETSHREATLASEAQALAAVEALHIAPRIIPTAHQAVRGLVRLPHFDGRLALLRTFEDGLALSTLITRAQERRSWQGARRWSRSTRGLFAAVVSALSRLHGAGLAHNDLKPDDILVRVDARGDFEAIFLDLGLAARPGRGGPGGTLAYAAPERLDGAPGDFRSDLWALGVILYELLAGTRPYPSEHPVDARLERRHPIAAPRDAARHAWASFPTVVQAALARLLAEDPRQRPRRASDLVAALELTAPSGSRSRREPSRSESHHRGAPPDRRRALAPLVAIAASALAVFLALGPAPRALGLVAPTETRCTSLRPQAEALCLGRGEPCVQALITAADCDAQRALLTSCEPDPAPRRSP